MEAIFELICLILSVVKCARRYVNHLRVLFSPKGLTSEETWQLGEQRVEAPVLREVRGHDGIEGHGCEDGFPGVLDVLASHVANGLLYVIALLLRAETILFRPGSDENEPG